MSARRLRAAAVIVGALAVLVALGPGFRGPEQIEISLHHLLHAVVLFGGAITGLLAQAAGARVNSRGARWLAPTIFAPIVAMFLMDPATYDFLDAHPLLHAADHLGYVFLGFTAAYCGERYASGIGWVSGFATVGMALLAVAGFGVTPTASHAAASSQFPASAIKRF